ncbi:hypothetical protein E3Q18_04461 [Wallemia mellicola]|uniref:Uncharacterized protein n=1 Tax=Wallemia mellicola TaxID=1708541 RepID=A0A4T0QBJ1_9BASI|nr:hypothetical protein E3Q23_04456 [Wallemia mellicola]TIB93539.1 hypothetical protein E3Q18_04461 [Wallemia mellicola]TIB96320.1 hypothetical protein E3Q16_04456 [Wallemia mellicola]TIC05722.1 hypothetical protein E3Q15_04480 [Wallemia mellicola]TIC06650.1 hypothetical protein E3Q14_04432 [Wallemia mellicola]
MRTFYKAISFFEELYHQFMLDLENSPLTILEKLASIDDEKLYIRIKIYPEQQYFSIEYSKELQIYYDNFIGIFIPGIAHFSDNISITYSKASQQELEKLGLYVSSLPQQLFSVTIV